LTFVGSVLGLAWQLDPTTLGPTAMRDPTALGREGNALRRYNVIHNANTLCPQCKSNCASPQLIVSLSIVHVQ